MLPMTYETFFKLANFKEILYAITLSSTFAGYWFIKALIINTIIIYVVFKKRKLLPFSIISITIYLLLSYNNIYSFIELPISVYPSFYYNLAYFVVGIFYATVEQKVTSCNIKTTYCVLSCFILIICSFIPFLYPICNLLIPFTLILTANYLFHNNKSYYKLRVMSILFYVLQFLAIHLYNKFIGKFDIDITHNLLGNSLIKFSLITLILFLISHLIIKLEKNKKFSYLKYLH